MQADPEATCEFPQLALSGTTTAWVCGARELPHISIFYTPYYQIKSSYCPFRVDWSCELLFYSLPPLSPSAGILPSEDDYHYWNITVLGEMRKLMAENHKRTLLTSTNVQEDVWH